MDIKRLIRVGTVSSVNAPAGTVRVAFAAQDEMVTYELPVITRGSKGNKDYWLPDVDEQVLCLFCQTSAGAACARALCWGRFTAMLTRRWKAVLMYTPLNLAMAA